MAGYLTRTLQEPWEFNIDTPDVVKKILELSNGASIVALDLEGEELAAALWGLEHFKAVTTGMAELKQIKMHELKVHMTEAVCTCGWKANNHELTADNQLEDLARIHAEHNRPSNITDCRL